MKLDSFKELLIKRAADMPDLQTLIKYMKDDFLLEHVLEALEKSHEKNHKKANGAIAHYGRNMTEDDAKEIHDALSHHASHYKAALNSGNIPVANAHAQKLFKIMHMAHKITKDKGTEKADHSDGALTTEEVAPHAWERSHYKPEGADAGSVTKGWGRSSGNHARWLSAGPHSEYHGKNSKRRDQDAVKYIGKPYPIEKIKINGRYLDIDDSVDSPESYKKKTPIVDAQGKAIDRPGTAKDSEIMLHEFDHHPIMKYYDKMTDAKDHTKNFNDQDLENYEKELKQYNNSSYRNNLSNRLDEKAISNPNRGGEMSAPVHTEENNHYKDIPWNNAEKDSVSPIQRSQSIESSTAINRTT